MLERIFFLAVFPPHLTILRCLSVHVKENYLLYPSLYDHVPDNKTHCPDHERMRVFHAICSPCVQVCWIYQYPDSEESKPTKYADSFGWQRWKEIWSRSLLISGTKGCSVVCKCKIPMKLCFLLKFFMKKENLHWGCFANSSKTWHLKVHPLSWLSVFDSESFCCWRESIRVFFVTSTIKLQQKVLSLIQPYCKTMKKTEVFVKTYLDHCNITVVVDQKKNNPCVIPSSSLGSSLKSH